MKAAPGRGILEPLDAKSIIDRIQALTGTEGGVLCVIAEGKVTGSQGCCDLAVFNVSTHEMMIAAVQLLRLAAVADPFRQALVGAICKALGFSLEATMTPAPSAMN